MLDNLPPIVRHLVLMLLATAAAWAGSDLVPWLQDQGGLAAITGALMAALVAVVTPLTRQYGVGRREAGR